MAVMSTDKVMHVITLLIYFMIAETCQNCFVDIDVFKGGNCMVGFWVHQNHGCVSETRFKPAVLNLS